MRPARAFLASLSATTIMLGVLSYGAISVQAADIIDCDETDTTIINSPEYKKAYKEQCEIDCSTAEWKDTTFCAEQNPKTNPIFGEGAIMRQVINVTILFVAIASVIMVIVGGMRLTMSGGDPQTVAASRKTIIYALVGLAVAVSAQVLVALVLNRL